MSKRVDVYQMVTDRIIEAIESGTVPWRKTWKGGDTDPQNFVSGHRYRGINALLAALSPYDMPYFLTFKQAKTLGGHIKKGASGLPIVFFKFSYLDKNRKPVSAEAAENRKDIIKVPIARYFSVFNIEDTEGIDYNLPEMAEVNDLEPIRRAEALIENMPKPPIIREAFRKSASYSPLVDTVNMPLVGQFQTAEEYHSTKFHELIHATGHQSRLAREGITAEAINFGSPTYSREELVAEIGAAFLCNKAGIETLDTFQNSASYLNGWLSRLKDDKNLIFVAARQARDAVDYILDGHKKAPLV